MGKYCTGWLDRLGECDWSEYCRMHDLDYMTSQGKGKSKWSVDWDMAIGVSTVCRPMAVVMWLGLTVLPVSYWYWYKYKDKRMG